MAIATSIPNITGGNPQNPGSGNTSVGESTTAFDTTTKELKVFDGTTLYGIVMPTSQSSLVSLTAASATLTAAAHAWPRTIAFNRGAGTAAVLPAATGTGNIFRFVVGTASNANTLESQTGAAFFAGSILINDAGDSTAATVDAYPANGTTHDWIKPTTAGGGGAVGDWFEVQDIASGIYMVRGMFQTSTDPATPFATS